MMKKLVSYLLSVLKNLFSTSKKSQVLSGEQERMHMLSAFWRVHEEYNRIMIDERLFRFLQLLITSTSTNGIRALCADFALCGLVLHIQHADKENIHMQFKKQIHGLYERRMAAMASGSVRLKILDIEIERLESEMMHCLSQESLFLASSFLALPAGVDENRLKIFSYLHKVGVDPLYFRQILGLKKFFFHSDHHTKQHVLSSLSSINPFSLPLFSHPQGVLAGVELNSHVPVLVDFFSGENNNILVLAKSGAGKTFLSKQLIQRLLLDGKRVIVFDPEREYIDLAKKYKGLILSEHTIHTFDSEMFVQDQISYFMNMLPVIFRNEKGLLFVQHVLRSSAHCTDFFRNSEHLPEIYKGRIYQYMFPYASGSFTSQDLIICTAQSDDVALFLYKLVHFALFSGKSETMLFIDEAHRVIDDVYIAQFIRQAAKRGRKYHLGICIITQDVFDLVQNKWSKALVANTTHTFLLKQEPIHMPLIKKLFHLESYDDFLEQVRIGEGIYLSGHTVRKLSFQNI